MGIDLVIFDCDGVLVDSELITTATIVEAVAALGVRWDAADIMRHFRGGKMSDVMSAAAAESGKALPEDFVPRFRARLFQRLHDEVQPVAGIAAALDAIVHPVCVASNGPRAKMETTLGVTGLLARFEGRIFTAYEVGSYKPDPGLFLHAAEALGASPSRCVVVEDSDTGVKAALAAGMPVLAYVGHGLPTDANGATTFEDMAMLPGLLDELA